MAFTWSDTTITTTGGSNFKDFAEDTIGAILCGVGNSGLVRTSVDGSTWVNRTAAASNSWNGIAFAPTLGTVGRLVAVASSGASRVMYSDDHGATWTSATASEANTWNSVCWVSWLSGGSFVAVAGTGTHRVMTSTDGITWANQTAASAKTWTSVTCSATAIVAVCSNSGTQQVMTSADAATWTLQTTPDGSQATGGVGSLLVYSDTLDMFGYVIFDNGTSQRKFCKSANSGVTWSMVAFPANRTWTGLRWMGNGVDLFGVISQTNTARFATSADGVSFTEEDTGTAGGSRSWNAMGWLGSARTVVSWGDASNTHMLVGAPEPTFDSLTPAFGTKRGGTVVTLTGTGLTGVTSVTFGGTAGLSVSVVDDTTVTAVTPPHVIGLFDVVIVGVGTLTNAFSFVSVDRVSPKAGTVAGNSAVTITGFGFAAASSVLFDGVAATSVVVVSNTSMTAVTPAHVAGRVDVEVVGVDTGEGLYLYTLPIPQNLGKGPLLPPIPTRRQT